MVKIEEQIPLGTDKYAQLDRIALTDEIIKICNKYNMFISVV